MTSTTQMMTSTTQILKFVELMIGRWKCVFLRKFPLLFCYRAVRFDG